jgi:hypothetical protein
MSLSPSLSPESSDNEEITGHHQAAFTHCHTPVPLHTESPVATAFSLLSVKSGWNGQSQMENESDSESESESENGTSLVDKESSSERESDRGRSDSSSDDSDEHFAS